MILKFISNNEIASNLSLQLGISPTKKFNE